MTVSQNVVPTPLDGEDITTRRWEDARHWISIYDDLLRFKRGLLARIDRDLATLTPIARRAASVDVRIVETQMERYLARLDLWYQRVWELRGLWLDPEGRIVRHQGGEARLSKREFQLLQFLLDHPHRFFTPDEIKGRAWADPALFPEQVRNYVRRIRKILRALQVPCDVVNAPRRGYSLVFRSDE